MERRRPVPDDIVRGNIASAELSVMKVAMLAMDSLERGGGNSVFVKVMFNPSNMDVATDDVVCHDSRTGLSEGKSTNK